MTTTDPLEDAPGWLQRSVPPNAGVDDELEQRIRKLAEKLPRSLRDLDRQLNSVLMYVEYDEAANLANAEIWSRLEECLTNPVGLLEYASSHMPPRPLARIVRQLAKSSDPAVRRRVETILRKNPPREVALPARENGDWDASGWVRGSERGRLHRQRAGTEVQEKHGLPTLASVGDVRELLGIRSTRQLGYYLLATDADNGPYHAFTIPKRDGSERTIHAPRGHLRWVQFLILRKIFDNIPVHDAAHGFVRGRSTVTNAQPHVGAEVVLKFDLRDFFPTIHYWRVVGLFTSLGYNLDDGRFGTDDASRQVAPTLARLCTHTPRSRSFNLGATPQGAPTSPAISNLVCRGLDARLAGLAGATGATYTRYADDLTFSFRAVDVNLGRFRWWVDQICQQEGFQVHQRKFRVIRRSQRQTVTGLVVNDELRIPRRDRRRFRAILHNCRRHGVESQARGNAAFRDYLRGFAAYVHMVHPEEGTRLLQEVEDVLREDSP